MPTEYEQQAQTVITKIIEALAYIQKNEEGQIYAHIPATRKLNSVVAHIIKATLDDKNYSRRYWGNTHLLDSVINALTPQLRDNIKVTYRTGYCNSTRLEEKDINTPTNYGAAYTQIAIFNPNIVGSVVLEAFDSVNEKPISFFSRIARKLHNPVYDLGY